MATLDFNSLQHSVIELVMKDREKTLIKVTTPTEGLIEQLRAAVGELRTIMETRDAGMIDNLYALIAKIISCNTDYMQVTADDLKSKYRLTLGDLVVFMNAYLDFINKIAQAKN